MSDIREAMRLIGGVAPSPEQVRRVQSIAHSLGIPNNDPMMMQYVALDCYFGVFSELPNKVNDAVNNAAKVAERNANLVVNDASKKVQTVVAESLEPLASAAFDKGVKKYIDRIDSEANDSARLKTLPVAVGVVAAAVLVGIAVGWAGGTWARSDADAKLIAAAAVAQKTVFSQLAQKDADTTATIANMRAAQDAAIADLKAEQAAKIEHVNAASRWAGTAEGQLAHKFFTVGGGLLAAKCQAEHWTLGETGKGEKLCMPQHSSFFGWKDGNVGWVIP